jgi:hypothetical protein
VRAKVADVLLDVGERLAVDADHAEGRLTASPEVLPDGHPEQLFGPADALHHLAGEQPFEHGVGLGMVELGVARAPRSGS